jgi:monoamine oxidase
MAHTPLLDRLQQAGSTLIGRREALKLGAVAGLAAGAAALGRPAGAKAAPGGGGAARIVVVGAGLAGLTCAYRLKRAGQIGTVYEASDRVGGRCRTIRGAFADGQLAERGGELIDQGHTHIRQLAQELGLGLDNLLAAEANGTEPAYHFDGAAYSYAQATEDLKSIWQAIHRDVAAASYPTLYHSFTPRGAELDRLSVRDWIEQHVPGGTGSRLGQLLDVAYTIEYGADASDQSSLNMLYLLGYAGPGNLRIFGKSNEKYRVRGGNDQLPGRLAAQLAGQLVTGHALAAVRENGDGTYALTFQAGSATRTVTADRVVLALPFSVLKAVDHGRAGFKPRKLTAIRELGMGTNAKLHVQLTSRHWEGLGCNGETFADTGYQSTWDVSRAQPGGSGLLVDYTGGAVGASFGSGTPGQRAQRFLGQLEPVLPGISARWNGRATVDFWPADPWARGSYSYWKPGQYTRFAGVEREQEGRLGACHFAGEHTSVDFQGYLNGAVETGMRAADEVLAALG